MGEDSLTSSDESISMYAGWMGEHGERSKGDQAVWGGTDVVLPGCILELLGGILTRIGICSEQGVDIRVI